ncbi:hypothetical protein AUEXF2481DRAFT_487516 [Aureobasidium subglaciale EXF-2481]|uniref:Uncharacterized protein n=1 Tax=Aureobasidium subglaciale (strain EXF-2481) TaxID=1043005 RepID=A0A074YWC4_AURSE|nr:uncharacterized protein AUEXF2481DRAFT_487516 [Aureobasidium subglaciale EXF-2481]KEQ98477.1 hypothetical protein AUEXF2481DRAFT_487516 [Aureobasidium subglaciale EXF-2481]
MVNAATSSTLSKINGWMGQPSEAHVDGTYQRSALASFTLPFQPLSPCSSHKAAIPLHRALVEVERLSLRALASTRCDIVDNSVNIKLSVMACRLDSSVRRPMKGLGIKGSGRIFAPSTVSSSNLISGITSRGPTSVSGTVYTVTQSVSLVHCMHIGEVSNHMTKCFFLR